VAGASGIAAGRFCDADRRCDTYSLVVHRRGPAPSTQANNWVALVKQPQSSLANKLNIRAVAALDEAREMPAGDARREAMRKARILRNAAEMHEHFFNNGGASAK
jgi:hypothetical protein